MKVKCFGCGFFRCRCAWGFAKADDNVSFLDALHEAEQTERDKLKEVR